jgi:Holliday junction resolvase YEN1
LDAIKNIDVIALSPGGFLLVALMAGSDYNEGVPGRGVATAHALARCGFGDTLLTATQTLLHGSNLEDFLDTWCDGLQLKLSTNSQGFL